jgi:molybdate/tungstate transport system substrate-binding protein
MSNVPPVAFRRRAARLMIAAALIVPLLGCEKTSGGDKDTVVVFVAASLSNALRPQLDSFAARTGTRVLTESGGSMEHVRKITELQRVPDLLLLADDEVFPKHLAPNHIGWWADFARNRMVVAYTDRSRGRDSITDANWHAVLSRSGVEVGRADPNLAPVGYRTLSMFVLAALHYGQVDLAQRLAANAPAKNVRANAAELAALLAAGELDYIYEYESVARAQGFRYILMPPEITGRPIMYALSIPTRAPHAAAGARLLEFLTGAAVRANLRGAHVDMLEIPVVHGDGAPAFLAKSR